MVKKRIFWHDILIKVSVLFTISALLVMGFWFHSNFYQYGFIPLVAVGGFVTLIIILAASRTLSPKPILGKRAKSTIEFSDTEKKAILDHSKRVHIVPVLRWASGGPRLNTLCNAVSDGEKFAVVYITDMRRSLYSEIEANAICIPDQDDHKSPAYSPGTLVSVIYFDLDSTVGTAGGA
jgi:hypothetical protein